MFSNFKALRYDPLDCSPQDVEILKRQPWLKTFIPYRMHTSAPNAPVGEGGIKFQMVDATFLRSQRSGNSKIWLVGARHQVVGRVRGLETIHVAQCRVHGKDLEPRSFVEVYTVLRGWGGFVRLVVHVFPRAVENTYMRSIELISAAEAVEQQQREEAERKRRLEVKRVRETAAEIEQELMEADHNTHPQRRQDMWPLLPGY